MSTPLTVETMPLSELITDPDNARVHDQANLAAIVGSLRRFGQREPLVVHQGTNIVIGGNGRLAAMRELGWTHASVTFATLTPTEAKGLALALNRSGEIASWDEAKLAELIADCRAENLDVGYLGWDEAQLDDIIADGKRALAAEDAPGDEREPDDDIEAEDPDGGPPEVEMVDAEPLPESSSSGKLRDEPVKLGDVWQLGRHRLMCGSSADHGAVEKLMNGKKAKLIWTDPPYNLGGQSTVMAAGVRKNYKKLKDAEWDQAFDFADVEQNMLAILDTAASVYVCTSHHLFGDIIAWFKTWADHHNFCVWTKSNPMPSLQKRHWTWCAELLAYGTRGKHTFNFPETGHALNVWPIAKNAANTLHPTQKPVGVPKHAILHSSAEDDIVVDLFGGSGSTLMACEETGRICYMMELDPKYVQTVLTRYEKGTGHVPVLLSTDGV